MAGNNIAGSVTISTASAERSIENLVKNLDRMTQDLEAASVRGAGGMRSLANGMDLAIQSQKGINAAVERLAGKLGVSDDALNEYRDRYKEIAAAEGEAKKKADEFREAAEQAADASRKLKQAEAKEGRLEDKKRSLSESGKPTDKIEHDLVAAKNAVADATEAEASAKKRLEDLESEAAETSEAYTAKLREQAEAIDKLHQSIRGEEETDFDSNNIMRMFNLLKSTSSKDFLTIFKFAGFNGMSVILKEFSKECERGGKSLTTLQKITLGFRVTMTNATKALKVFSKSLATEFFAIYVVGAALAKTLEAVTTWWKSAEENAKAAEEATRKAMEAFREIQERSRQRIEVVETPDEKAKKDLEDRKNLLRDELRVLKEREQQLKRDLELEKEISRQRKILAWLKEYEGGPRWNIAQGRIENPRADLQKQIEAAELERTRIAYEFANGTYDTNYLDNLDMISRDMKKALADITPAKEADINATYEERKKIYQNELRGASDVAKILQNSGFPEEAERFAKGMKAAQEQAAEAIRKEYLYTGATGELIRSLEETKEPIEEYKQTLEELSLKHKTVGAAFSNYEAAVEAAGKKLREKTLKEIDDGMQQSRSQTAIAVERLDRIQRWEESTGDAGHEAAGMRNWAIDQFIAAGPLGEITKATAQQQTAAERSAEAMKQIEEGFRAGLYDDERRARLMEQVTGWLTQEQAAEKNRKETEIGAYLQGTVEAYQAEIRARTHRESRVESAVERGNRIAESSKGILGSIERLARTITDRKDVVVG